MKDDPFFYWRIAPYVSVEDAAILMVGGDPETTDRVENGPDGSCYEEKRTTGHKGFQAALNALTGAILSDDISARVSYKPSSDADLAQSREIHVGLLGGKYNAEFLPLRDGHLRVRVGKVDFRVQPNWALTTVKMVDLRKWLDSNEAKSTALSLAIESEVMPFQNPDHEHFAPELDFAVTAWRALESVEKFKYGTKPVIKQWIEDHPEVWRGEGEMSTAAKERIAVLINWRRAGAAKSNG